MQNFFIMTGSMGSGKSTLLDATAAAMGYTIVKEPARDILAAQRTGGGDAVPELNPAKFTQLMLLACIESYEKCQTYKNPVVFDRGIPDMIAYAELFGLDTKPYWAAAKKYAYNKYVFFLPDWEDIYETDDERKMTFKEAQDFGHTLLHIYKKLNYSLIEIPKSSVTKRIEFLKDFIK